MRRVAGSTLALALGIALGCFGEDTLENEACVTNSDCARTQECVKTVYQATNEPYGWCRPDGECAKGEQPGCECKFSDSRFVCEGNLWPTEQGPECICCPVQETQNPGVGVRDPATGTCLAPVDATGTG